MDNTIKLRVILLCFAFTIFGYIVGNFNTLKADFCAPKISQENTYNDTIEDTSSSVYIIKEGDTLEKVAKLFSTSKEALMKENKIKTENVLTGTALVIPETKK